MEGEAPSPEKFVPSEATLVAWNAQVHMDAYSKCKPDSVHAEVEQAAANQAFNHLTELTYPGLFAAAMKRTAQNEDTTRDILQDTYERAYKGLPKFNSDAQVETWLFRIMLNRLSTHYSKQARELKKSGGVSVELLQNTPANDRLSDPAAYIVGLELPPELREALDALTPKRRMAVILKHVVGLSHAEVGRRIGISEGAAKVSVHHALSKMRDSLGIEHKHVDK